MTSFTIQPLAASVANHLRATPQAPRYIADEFPGYPCRECLRDAQVGEELILVSHDPFHTASPYRTASPIFVHLHSCGEDDNPEDIHTDDVPLQLRRRQLSVRAFDSDEMMIDAKVVDGVDLHTQLETFFELGATSFVDIHNASRGCWAARATREPQA
jgi:Protein of unknown function (DUF1203)